MKNLRQEQSKEFCFGGLSRRIKENPQERERRRENKTHSGMSREKVIERVSKSKIGGGRGRDR